MSTEFLVEKNDLKTQPLRKGIEEAIKGEAGGNPQMIFGLIVAVNGGGRNPTVCLLCGKSTQSDIKLTPYLTAWNSTTWDIDQKFPSTALLHPEPDGILIAEYPTDRVDDAYVGFCTYIGGQPRWF